MAINGSCWHQTNRLLTPSTDTVKRSTDTVKRSCDEQLLESGMLLIIVNNPNIKV